MRQIPQSRALRTKFYTKPHKNKIIVESFRLSLVLYKHAEQASKISVILKSFAVSLNTFF